MKVTVLSLTICKTINRGEFMPTWINHFRVADKIIDKIDNIDKQYFAIGTIAPDCGIQVKPHGIYEPPSGVTHFTKELKYSKKTDCDYIYVYEHYVANENDLKKKSFFLAYTIHLFTDCVFAKNIFMPIEEKYGDFRYNEDLSKRVKLERNNIDFMFVRNNVSPTFEIFKSCGSFNESYPDWYKHNEINKKMKFIIDWYENCKCQDLDYKYVTPKMMDDFVAKTAELIKTEFNF